MDHTTVLNLEHEKANMYACIAKTTKYTNMLEEVNEVYQKYSDYKKMTWSSGIVSVLVIWSFTVFLPMFSSLFYAYILAFTMFMIGIAFYGVSRQGQTRLLLKSVLWIGAGTLIILATTIVVMRKNMLVCFGFIFIMWLLTIKCRYDYKMHISKISKE